MIDTVHLSSRRTDGFSLEELSIINSMFVSAMRWKNSKDRATKALAVEFLQAWLEKDEKEPKS